VPSIKVCRKKERIVCWFQAWFIGRVEAGKLSGMKNLGVHRLNFTLMWYRPL